jgi:hypothetical protein
MTIAASLLAGAAAIASACGGGNTKDATPTPGATSTAPPRAAGATVAPKTPTATAAPSAATAAATAASDGTPAPAATPAGDAPSGGRALNETQARALLDEASLVPRDIGADWVITADTPSDNAAAAAADPTSAASNERCGRLAGRLVTNGPKDTVSAHLGGSIVSAFSQLAVYATAAGAADCSVESTARFAQAGELARAFGSVFVNPDAVAVKPVDYPTVGDGSFATALTGDINAAGTVVQLQIVVVGFLKGNTSAVVGVAYAPLTTPSTKELQPFVDLVLQRISANQ